MFDRFPNLLIKLEKNTIHDHCIRTIYEFSKISECNYGVQTEEKQNLSKISVSKFILYTIFCLGA